MYPRLSRWIYVALFACLLVYWPGLNGGFVYDDFAFIVANEAVHVQSLAWDEWEAALDSFPAAHQGRWLGMLSFAGNHYLHGLDPWGYKLTNVLIHLLNGWLVWMMLRALLALRTAVKPGQARSIESDAATAALIAGIWLVLPINLTAVLYVGQRLESLSNTFVILGLLLYFRLRVIDWKNGGVAPQLYGSVLACTLLGSLVKESAVLLPLFIACVEVILLRFRRSDGSRSAAATRIFVVMLVVPLMIGLSWLATWIGSERAYSRSFDTVERVLTQGRVLLHYMNWILLPSLSELTLYHDDINISRGLFTPWTTLPSIVAIGGLLLGAWWMRSRFPLFALGIFFFFCGHALTSTVIPLMLAFEHRNYFPSLGLLLAAASLLGLEFKILQSRIRAIILLAVGLFYVGTTHLRVQEWSSPVRLASSEATKRPDSVDAQYDYARTLIRYSGDDPHSPAVDAALARMQASRGLPGSGILFEHAIWMLQVKRDESEDPQLWPDMIRSAGEENARASDVSAAFTLYECMKSESCPARYPELLDLVDAFITHDRVDARFFALRGLLMSSVFQDPVASRMAFSRAIELMPKDIGIRISYIHSLVESGDRSAAEVEVGKLRVLRSARARRAADALQAGIASVN